MNEQILKNRLEQVKNISTAKSEFLVRMVNDIQVLSNTMIQLANMLISGLKVNENSKMLLTSAQYILTSNYILSDFIQNCLFILKGEAEAARLSQEPIPDIPLPGTMMSFDNHCDRLQEKLGYNHSPIHIISKDAQLSLIHSLHGSLKTLVIDLEIAYKKENLNDFKKMVHRAHAGFCYTGTPQLLQVVKALHNALKAEDIPNIERLYQNLLRAIDIFSKTYELYYQETCQEMEAEELF